MIEEYLRELADSARPVVSAKLVNLSNLRSEELAYFRAVWGESELERRRQVVTRLIELAEDNVELNFDAVFLACLDDADADVRRLAMRGLWEYEERDLILRLVGILQGDADPQVRAEAALSLSRFVLRAEFDELRATDAEAVEDALRQVIAREEEEVGVRARAVEALGVCSRDWAHAIIEAAYASADHRLRISAVHAMSRSCDPRWLPRLIDELSSPDAEMRYEAAGACQAIADESAVPYLTPLLEDEDAEVQEAAIEALGQTGGDEAREALEGYRSHPEPRVREVVEAALTELEFGQDPLGFKLRE
jgi:bilin biosynthesis protein